MKKELDRIFIRDLLVRGIVGINPEERTNRQDVVVNVTLWADTRPAAASDQIEDAINYRTVAKAIIAYIEQEQPYLAEKLAADLVRLSFETDARIQAIELSVEKVGAIRFAYSVGLTLYRERAEVMTDGG